METVSWLLFWVTILLSIQSAWLMPIDQRQRFPKFDQATGSTVERHFPADNDGSQDFQKFARIEDFLSAVPTGKTLALAQPMAQASVPAFAEANSRIAGLATIENGFAIAAPSATSVAGSNGVANAYSEGIAIGGKTLEVLPFLQRVLANFGDPSEKELSATTESAGNEIRKENQPLRQNIISEVLKDDMSSNQRSGSHSLQNPHVNVNANAFPVLGNQKSTFSVPFINKQQVRRPQFKVYPSSHLISQSSRYSQRPSFPYYRNNYYPHAYSYFHHPFYQPSNYAQYHPTGYSDYRFSNYPSIRSYPQYHSSADQDLSSAVMYHLLDAFNPAQSFHYSPFF